MVRAFEQNTRAWQPLFGVEPTGWSAGARKRLAQVLAEADSYVQALNSRFTDPSGDSHSRRSPRASDEETPAPDAMPATAANALEGIKPPADFVPDEIDTVINNERR